MGACEVAGCEVSQGGQLELFQDYAGKKGQ